MLTFILRWILNNLQLSVLYQPARRLVNLPTINQACPGINYISFPDSDGDNPHIFLYKEPSGGERTNIFLGAFNLDLNSGRYLAFINNFHKTMPHAGLLIPVYYGYHTKNGNPQEKKIKQALEKMFRVLSSPTPTTFTKLYINESGHLVRAHSKEAFELRNITLIGYSVGSAIAAYMASKSEIVDKLILIAPPTSGRKASVEELIADYPDLAEIIEQNKDLLTEEYDTLKFLYELHNKIEVALISYSSDKFSRSNNNEKSHFAQISLLLKENNVNPYSIVLSQAKMIHEIIPTDPFITNTIYEFNNDLLHKVLPHTEKNEENKEGKEDKIDKEKGVSFNA